MNGEIIELYYNLGFDINTIMKNTNINKNKSTNSQKNIDCHSDQALSEYYQENTFSYTKIDELNKKIRFLNVKLINFRMKN